MEVQGNRNYPGSVGFGKVVTNGYRRHVRGRKSEMALTQVSSNKCAGGFQKVFEHDSTELKCKMKFAIYLPPKAETDKCPVMYWLSGLTCTEQNFITKAGVSSLLQSTTQVRSPGPSAFGFTKPVPKPAHHRLSLSALKLINAQLPPPPRQDVSSWVTP
ncbi:S-formylglutathione hydrolase isoform X1 [Lates japonicus]|uniref:S-formylglutathione hydrolase n=1 Tax=Lates japonicus TaxID=270547 RepID=A0AAD3NLX1_LATJO|nr:S-formylglutathione hydrolase isoform X1 [Lates japonicus]